MFTLGVNGWMENGHDASACLFKNNKLICFAEEERFTRKKHAYDSLPHNAIQFCLNEAKIDSKKLDFVVFSWNYPKLYKLAKKKFYSKKELTEIFFPEKMFGKIKAKILFMDHHLSHASSAYRCSGFNNSAILVIDGQGEDISTSIWKGKGNKIKLVKEFKVKDSLGYFYEAANSFLGFRLDDSGKTMGLSSYGKPSILQEKIKLNEEGYSFDIKLKKSKNLDFQKEVIEQWLHYFTRKFGSKNKRKYIFDKENSTLRYNLRFNRKYRNFAASIQETINQLVFHLAKISIKLTGSKKLCIAGGVGLNCVANGKLAEENILDDLFIQPICNDAGTSLGAAMELIANKEMHPNFRMRHVYFGPSFTNNEIKNFLDKRKINYRYFKNISKKTAELLAKGKIVGWFQGKMEGGPRALGNRSILANPSNPKMKDKVNEVKFREKWRPLCPSIIEEVKGEYVKSSYNAPFMILNFKIKKHKITKIPSVVHVDGTSRIHTVNKKINLLYWEVINRLGKITGEAIVLNTSLNSKNEPIACSPKEALNNFCSSAMDALVLNNFLIEK